MPLVHEFGIIDDFDSQKKYNDYTPQKYTCISVDDDSISSLLGDLSKMKTYFHSYSRPEYGLDYYGITIIPPESLSLFYDVITSSGYYKNSAELSELASKIQQAAEEKKYMIHYGI
ncbi:short-chain dehydrogenase [Bacillus sp. RJGP41]|nr:short-chain dehydrogenase [Bacillus sp. RJGP41]